MSSGIFQTDWYVDPPWDRLSLSWLQNYANNIRGNPTVLASMQADGSRFEMVPMPRQILQSLASRPPASVAALPQPTRPPAGAEPSFNQYLKDREVGRSADALIGLVRSFVDGLEAGKIEQAMLAIAPGYRDRNDRDASQLQTDLQNLIRNFPNLKIVPFKAEDLQLIGNHIVGTVHLAWEAKKGDAYLNKTSRIEIIFEKNSQGEWRIGGMHVL